MSANTAVLTVELGKKARPLPRACRDAFAPCLEGSFGVAHGLLLGVGPGEPEAAIAVNHFAPSAQHATALHVCVVRINT